MFSRRMTAFFIIFGLLLCMSACDTSKNFNAQEQGGYVVPEDVLAMDVNWTVSSADRRSQVFKNVIFAGDIVDDWAEQLSEEIGIYQKSVPTIGYANMDEVSEVTKYDLVILADGIFSLLRGQSAAAYAAQLDEIIAKVINNAKEDTVILVTSLPYLSKEALGEIPVERVAEYNATIRAVAMGKDVLYANIYRAQSQASWTQAEDGMSFNKVGNMLVAGEVLQCLMRACTCLAADGLNQQAKNAVRVKQPTDEVLHAFCDAQDANQMLKAVTNNSLGAGLELFKSLSNAERLSVCEDLIKTDRSQATSYMIADLLINLTTMKKIGSRQSVDWIDLPFETYVSVGDSITAGYGAVDVKKDAWATRLADYISTAQGKDVTHINKAISGTEMCKPVQYFPAAKDTVQQYIVPMNPDLVTIAYGVNDIRSGTDLETFRITYRGYLQEVIDFCPNAVIVVIGICYMGSEQYGTQIKEWNETLRELAEEFDLIYCDIYSDMYGVNWLLMDTLHPNNAGYRLMASTVFRALCENVNMAE